ncbi:PAS domain S-box protein [Thermodesulfobacteriota bacterium]
MRPTNPFQSSLSAIPVDPLHLSKILDGIRPSWKTRNLVSRVERLFDIDLNSACQRLFNAAIQDLREKILLTGVESIHKTTTLHDLPPISNDQSLKYYPILNLIELAHVLDLLSGEERKSILQCSRIFCDLAQENDEEVDARDILFLFKACVTCLLDKESVQIAEGLKGKRTLDAAYGRSSDPDTSQTSPKEERPKEKAPLLEAILDSIPEMILYHDSQLNVLWANKATGDFVGLTREDIIGKYFYEIACRSEVPCDDCPVWKGCSIGNTQKTEKIENRLLNGRLYYTRSFPILDAGVQIPGRLVVAQDITSLKYRYGVNEALNLISEAFSSSWDFRIICKKLVGIITKQFFYPAGEIILYDDKTKEIVVMVEVDGSGSGAPLTKRQPLCKTFARHVLEGGKVINISSLRKSPDFDRFGLEKTGAEAVIAIPVKVEERTIGALILTDFVERLDASLIVDALQAIANRLGAEILRKQAEERLRRERNFTTTVLNNAGSLILVIDREGRIVRFNKACERLTGYSHKELRGRYIWKCLIPPEENDSFITLFPFNTEKIRELPSSFENNWMTKEGQKRLISWSNTLMGDGKETEIHIVSIGIDITEKRKVEKEAELRQRQLIQADKMASLGILVSGVAHELNNPNNFIMMNTPILREAWDDITPILKRYFDKKGDFTLAGIPYSEMSDQILALFDGIQEGAKRIQQIVMSLKDYSREDTSDFCQEVDLNKTVEAALRLLTNQIKNSTESIHITFSEKLPPVKGNFQRLEQVIINLIQNACQALPTRDKGINIRTFYDKKNSEVVVRVKDEGIGIDMESIDKIFDPFYTTKRDTGGTGLGLSVCAGIMKEHNGRLEFSSKPGKGTIACLVIPAVVE